MPMPAKDAEPGAEREDDVFAVRVTATQAQADELVGRGEFDFGDRPHFRATAAGGRLDLFVTRPQIEALRAEGFEVEVASNQSARLRDRLGEVGRGDRFEGGGVPPRGLGRKVGGRGPSAPPPDGPGSTDEPEGAS
jgi:hypothetical protein